MPLQPIGYIDLPANVKEGGFDHAHIHHGLNRLYVAHTCNDAVDVIDCAEDRYLFSVADLPGVAGALVSEAHDLVFTSNRSENTVGIFDATDSPTVTKIAVGIKPNGLSYDPTRNRLLAAHVGDPNIAHSFTVSLIDVDAQSHIAQVLVPGRTRWTVFDPHTDAYYINIASPSQVAVIETESPSRIARVFNIPSAGPHGLDLDMATQQLFCACDGKLLVCVNMNTGSITQTAELSGVPDVICFDPTLTLLYVAIGDPGIIEVFHTQPLRRVQAVSTESGSHTVALDLQSHRVYAFLPHSHRAMVFEALA